MEYLATPTNKRSAPEHSSNFTLHAKSADGHDAREEGDVDNAKLWLKGHPKEEPFGMERMGSWEAARRDISMLLSRLDSLGLWQSMKPNSVKLLPFVLRLNVGFH